MGVATRCGCKEVYRFPHTIYLSLYTPLVYVLFTAASLFFVDLKKEVFSFFFNIEWKSFNTFYERSIGHSSSLT